ncbi:hypothetical protein CF326_g2947 [Tilletia indica]|uniref:D-isomer specific 2-hydroxyacid dehydrogenase NAD-binding domain-containing protein n=1 Tax=Tilletia indica TaxID=43049 RepID=A0A177TTH1_9BASI|nr:hypothetical protein CF326_g2947 [Tilletia indica]KAE8260453.1 hypothetical protein A4X13_0g339 [Tilletia indica]
MSSRKQHETFQSWHGGARAEDVQPGPIAIVTDSKGYKTWAPGFKEDILARVPQADVRTGIDVQELAAHAEDVVGVVWLSHSPAGLGEALKAEGSKIRWVQLPSAGIEKHAAVILAHPDIIWTTAKGAFAEPVAEHGLALTLALMRYLPARVIATSWGPSAGISLFRNNVVILGAGGIALAYLSLLSPFRCTTHLVRRNPSDLLKLPSNVDSSLVSVHAFGKLDDLLPTADVLFLACALTAETRGLLNERTLKLLPKHCIIVNVGRGGLIVTDALVEALRKGQVGGVGLDVTDPEPLPQSHPLFHTTTIAGAEEGEQEQQQQSHIDAQRLNEIRANVIVTPHTADTAEMVRPSLSERAAVNAAALYGHSQRFEGQIRIDGEHVY